MQTVQWLSADQGNVERNGFTIELLLGCQLFRLVLSGVCFVPQYLSGLGHDRVFQDMIAYLSGLGHDRVLQDMIAYLSGLGHDRVLQDMIAYLSGLGHDRVFQDMIAGMGVIT